MFHFNQVPVVVQPGFWPLPVLATGVLAWLAGRRKLERSWPQRLGVGLLALPVAFLAEVGHAFAHTVSARLAGALTDAILLHAGMPQTLYLNNEVPPQAHIRRSLGGPAFSLAGFLLSLLWRRNARAGSLNRELAEVSLASHSIIFFGSFAPVQVVDGGVILKWKLVEAGRSPEQADRLVRKVFAATSAVLAAAGISTGWFWLRKSGKKSSIGLAG